jgi:hypothetical protein
VGGHADVRKNDDQVDALSIIGQMLEIMVPPKLANVVRVPQLPRDYVQAHELERDSGYSWRTAWAPAPTRNSPSWTLMLPARGRFLSAQREQMM